MYDSCWITFTRSLRTVRRRLLVMTAVVKYLRMCGHVVWIALRYLWKNAWQYKRSPLKYECTPFRIMQSIAPLKTYYPGLLLLWFHVFVLVVPSFYGNFIIVFFFFIDVAHYYQFLSCTELMKRLQNQSGKIKKRTSNIRSSNQALTWTTHLLRLIKKQVND